MSINVSSSKIPRETITEVSYETEHGLGVHFHFEEDGDVLVSIGAGAHRRTTRVEAGDWSELLPELMMLGYTR